MLVEFIDIGQSLVIGKTKPGSVQFGPKVSKGAKIVFYGKGNPRRLAQIGFIQRSQWCHHGCRGIQHQLKVPEFTETGGSQSNPFTVSESYTITNSGTDVWTDAASDPINDLLVWRRLVLRHFGQAPTDVYLGNGAGKAFINNTKVKDLFNKWNINLGTISPTATDNMIHYGFIQSIGMSVHSVNEFFIDPNDLVEKEMLDDGRCLLLTNGYRAARYYGAIQVVDGLIGVPRFPMSWIEKDPSVRWVQLHSAALPCIEQPDGVLTATVI